MRVIKELLRHAPKVLFNDLFEEILNKSCWSERKELDSYWICFASRITEFCPTLSHTTESSTELNFDYYIIDKYIKQNKLKTPGIKFFVDGVRYGVSDIKTNPEKPMIEAVSDEGELVDFNLFHAGIKIENPLLKEFLDKYEKCSHIYYGGHIYTKLKTTLNNNIIIFKSFYGNKIEINLDKITQSGAYYFTNDGTSFQLLKPL